MYLKSLQLQGFKSFPDKTTIQFAGGMTAIVGPNGSGKSNISDAIRWVLGEQSTRNLRGAKMEDVIFGGTQKRGPVGFAEVSLILDNSQKIFASDYTEIMVTRRYYRSGESEYYINRKHVRLKDIHELFMDTGLGREGYSIIGQGRIDEILSLKSEDRREIFEEAAGITKFRYRKEEAERRLQQAEENLIRIRDIWTELDAQAGPLSKQAEKAKKYLILRDRLRVLEVSLWMLSLGGIEDLLSKNDDEIRIAEKDLETAKGQQLLLQSTAEEYAEQIRDKDIKAEELRAELSKSEESAASKASRCAVLEANIKNNQENIASAQSEMHKQLGQKDSLSEQIAAREQRISELLNAINEISEAINSQMAEIKVVSDEYSENTHLTEALRLDFDRISAELLSFQAKKSAAQENLDGMQLRQGTIDGEISTSGAKLKAEQDEHENLKQLILQSGETISGHSNMLTGLKLKAESRKKHVEDNESRKSELLSGIKDSENRIRMLTELQRDYEGFSHAVKLVMNRTANGGLRGIHGPVSSLLTVSGDFVVAIETVLGAAASNIIVDTAQDGKNAIAFLKSSDGGRATFLPIDTIKPMSLRENGLEHEAGFLGVASELIACEPRYNAIMSNILGRTAVVDHMDTAIRISQKYGNRFRIVTLDGQLINAGGAMTGGSVSKSSGILSRANQLSELQKKTEAQKKMLQTVSDALEKAKREYTSLDYELNTILELQAAQRQEHARLEATLLQHKALLDSLEAHDKQLRFEKENIDSARLEAVNRIVQLEDSVKKTSEEKLKLSESLKAANDKNQAYAVRISEGQDSLSTLKTSLAESQTELSAQNSTLSELRGLQNNMSDDITFRNIKIEEYEGEIERLAFELSETKKMQTEQKDNCTKLRELIQGVLAQRMRLEGEKTKLDKELQASAENILSLEKEKARLETKRVQTAGEEKQILDRMWETYELTPSSAELVAFKPDNVSETEREVSELKGEIRSLGNVNLDSVEEYAKLCDRLSFITEQKLDLETAQAELYKVIEQLTINMKEIFASEFARLNTYFGETFREIFGGGHAELRLEDTADILNCGIEIRVSPPGKALKTITLLSGGEKAFVAIALYFSILKVRPTPFCVLDEIEAALDDVNVTRFAKYIRKLSNNTQFIVITHRRGTMEESDMLYGVTMQEQGISKLLMLNMADAERALNIKLN